LYNRIASLGIESHSSVCTIGSGH